MWQEPCLVTQGLLAPGTRTALTQAELARAGRLSCHPGDDSPAERWAASAQVWRGASPASQAHRQTHEDVCLPEPWGSWDHEAQVPGPPGESPAVQAGRQAGRLSLGPCISPPLAAPLLP